MPLYFFDVFDNGVVVTDEFGIELDNVLEARHQAIAILPDMARNELPDGDQHEFKAVVRDQGGHALYVAKLTYCGEWDPDSNPADPSAGDGVARGEEPLGAVPSAPS